MIAACVVKLGGSLALSPRLASWVAAVEGAAGRIVVVPGGGPFADRVRSCQAAMGFDDVTAHRMALLAMEQFALVLAARSALLSMAASEREIRRAVAAGLVPVWCPAAMAAADPALPASWAVTSDSLALWLARQIGARRLVLVKSVDPEAERTTAAELADDGIIDAAFEGLLRNWDGEAWLAGPGSHGALAALVAGKAAGSRTMTRIGTVVPAG